MIRYLVLIVVILGIISCAKDPEIDNSTMLDGDQIFDASIYHPEKYLASKYMNNASPQQLDKPVIICAHGFSATTFEWDEFREFADLDSSFYVSQVLLGGHGRTYQDFKNATWQDWQTSICDEYKALSNLGFKNIYLVGSSTGAPLIVNMVKSGFFNNLTPPKGIFLIDPIVISGNKTLTMVSTLGPVLGYTTTELDSGEQGHWYVYRPYQSLKQLMELIDQTRKDLESGFKLPAGTFMKIYKTTKDEVADPVSAVLLYKGIRNSAGGKIEVEMLNSKLHVFTRLRGRNNVTNNDFALQTKAFNEMKIRMTN